MKRLLTLWLPLLAVCWLARTLLDSLTLGRIEGRLAGPLAVAAIPALQALALGWVTRAPGPSPVLAMARALRRHRTLQALLALDLAASFLAFALPDQAWLAPTLGDAPDGNPASILAGAQALLAGLLFLRSALPSRARRGSRLLFSGFGLALGGLAALLAVDGLSLLGEVLFPAESPLFWKLSLHAPALALALALLFAVQDRLRSTAAEIPLDRDSAATSLGAAAACAWIALLLSLAGSLFAESPPLPLEAPVAFCALLGTTALVAAGLAAPAKGFSREDV